MLLYKCEDTECLKAFHVGCAKWGNAYGVTFKYFPGKKSYGCCPQHSHLTFSDMQSASNTTDGDKLSLEERRRLRNIGNEAMDEDYLSYDESSSEDEEEHQDQEPSEEINAEVSHTKKRKKRRHPSQQKRKNDNLTSNSEKYYNRKKDIASICKKMKKDLQARLESCISIKGIDKAYRRCKSHFQSQESISSAKFDACWKEVKEDLERMVDHTKQHLESPRKVSGKRPKLHRKNNDDKDKWAHLFVRSGFQMGDPKSRIASGWDKDL